MKKRCHFCGQNIRSSKGRLPSNCNSKSTIIESTEECWLETGTQMQKWCVLSSPFCSVSISRKIRIYQLLKDLALSSLKSSAMVEKYIIGLSAFERYDLIDCAVDELRDKLVPIYTKNNLSVFPYPNIPELPENLPQELSKLIDSYRNMLLKRYEVLLQKGHQRSNNYVARESSDAIRFVKYLGEKGFDSWADIGKKDLVKYLEDTNARLSSSLKRFITYANNKKSHFKKVKTGKPKRNGTVLTETPRPKIVPPEIVNKLLQDIKANFSSPEYILAWLVCRMGLTLKKAHELSLAQIKINDDGKCVIKPAEVWVSLPKGIGSLMIELANKSFPRWEIEAVEKLEYQKLFSKEVPNRDEFGKKVLLGYSRELRVSAIFALMQKGHTDRVTIKRTTGMSMPTIVKIESLLSSDLHRRLDPEFIKLRNQHILGEEKE